MLDSIRVHNPTCKFINLGSAAVYGNPDELPVKESQTVHPVSPYGHHKLMAESICQEFYQFFDIATCSVRIFSAFGPGLKKQLFWDLYKKSLQSEEVVLYGTGNETRDFIYVEDLVRALEGIYLNGSFQGDAINIGRGIQISIKEAVATFYTCLNYKGKVSFKGENRVGDPLNWVADISKIKSMNVHPKEDLTSGLRKYVAWLEENA
jgi:dTDP-glucose 4,6-dehydratase/UDP-glucose 4-epimerase